MKNKIYYNIKPVLPRWIQIQIRRHYIRKRLNDYKDVWPIDRKAAFAPENWSGWPDHKKFAMILTHDVEKDRGQKKCMDLVKIEKELGFRSSFYFVPERYKVEFKLRDYLNKNGFEVGVHGLKHDGKLFRSYKIFEKRSIRINQYLKDWKAVGFRSPAMHRNLEWIHKLNIKYDLSTFDTDPFEPQPNGMQTIFPFIVKMNGTNDTYVELPYTIPQDFSLYILLKEKNNNIWKEKLDWIAKFGGMALINVHPDYISFNKRKQSYDEYPLDFYVDFLEYVKTKYSNQYWNALPREVAEFWYNRFHI